MEEKRNLLPIRLHKGFFVVEQTREVIVRYETKDRFGDVLHSTEKSVPTFKKRSRIYCTIGGKDVNVSSILSKAQKSK